MNDTQKPKIELYEHQKDAINRLIKNKGSLVIAHPVGSGKTLTAIAGMEKLREKGMGDKALVITPASLRDNFANNIDKISDVPYAILGNKQEVASGDRSGLEDLKGDEKYHIISYDMFKKDPEKYLKATGADTIIADELHRAKDDSTQVFDALKNTRDKYKNFIGLTGSVISNRPSEVLPLVDIVSNGQHSLGKNVEEFDRKFLVRGRSQYGKGPVIGIRNRKLLERELGKYVDYMHIDDLHDTSIPDKLVQDVPVEMSPEQTKLYKKAVAEIPLQLRKKMDRGEQLTENELKKFYNTAIVARQISNGVHIGTPGMTLAQSAEATPKIKRMLDDIEDHLSETPDGQVLVTTNLIHGGADVLETGLQARGIKYGAFLGKGNKGITEASRQKDVEDYNNGKLRVMLISGAGSEGLSLNNTTMIASADGHYNPERINQMEARGIRSGGLAQRAPEDRKVMVRRYESVLPRPRLLGIKLPIKPKSSIDQDIYNIAKKKALTNQLVLNVMRDSREKAAALITEVMRVLEKYS